jgi:hypothetical protein
MKKKTGYKKLYLLIACFLLVLEVGIRVSASTLSGNIQQINKIPYISQELSENNGVDNNTVLFLGNSLLGNAVNLELFVKDIKQVMSDGVAAYKVTLDATALWDWYCIVKNNFADSDYAPQSLVVGFAWEQLGDIERPRPSRLASHFCGIKDLPDLVKLGMNSPSDVLEYLVASISKLYALRQTIHKRVLDYIIPQYRMYAQKLNASGNVNNKQAISQRSQSNYTLFSKFLSMLAQNDVEAIIIAMPVIEKYSLDPALVGKVHDAKGVFYDFRRMEGIKSSMYLDPIHLNSIGSEIFTQKVAIDLGRNLNK